MTQYIRGKSVYETHPAESKLFIDANEDEEIDSGQPYWLIKEDDGITIGVLDQAFFKIDCSGNLIINDIAQGDIFYVDASGHIVKLAAGTDGWFLKTQGAGANPLWASVGGGGDMLKSTYDTGDNGVVDNSEKLEGSTKAQVQDHTPKAHTLASHSSKAHSELTGIGSSDHHTLYTHPSARQCSTGNWAWGSITGKPSNYPTNIANISGIPGTIASILNDHDKAAHDALNINADQVDGCDASDNNGDVFKIPSITQGDIFFVDASLKLIKLAASTDGYQLTTHGSGNNPAWGTPTYGTVADLVFEEQECAKCGKRFKISDDIILKVIEFDENGNTTTIPIHESCTQLPPKKIIIKRKVMEDYWFWDYEKGIKLKKRAPKVIKIKKRRRELRKGYSIDPATGDFLLNGKIMEREETTVMMEVEISETVYENKEYVI